MQFGKFISAVVILSLINPNLQVLRIFILSPFEIGVRFAASTESKLCMYLYSTLNSLAIEEERVNHL